MLPRLLRQLSSPGLAAASLRFSPSYQRHIRASRASHRPYILQQSSLLARVLPLGCQPTAMKLDQVGWDGTFPVLQVGRQFFLNLLSCLDRVLQRTALQQAALRVPRLEPAQPGALALRHRLQSYQVHPAALRFSSLILARILEVVLFSRTLHQSRAPARLAVRAHLPELRYRLPVQFQKAPREVEQRQA